MLQDEFNQRFSRAAAPRWHDPRVPPLTPPSADGGPSTWSKTRETLESTIGRYPGISFGVALFTGIALGWWIKRR